MMDCQKFLAGYSEWRDGTLSWAERVEFEVHVDECPSCARYDHVVSGGVDVLHGLPELEVSEDFGERLRHSLYHVDEEMRLERRRGTPVVATGTLAIAATLAAAAWVPLMQPRETVGTLPAVAVSAPGQGAFVRRLLANPFHQEATGLTSKLAEIGVRIQEMPYHDVIFGADGALGGSVAVMDAAEMQR